jgi:endonuclease YncB( thermonuclease family)
MARAFIQQGVWRIRPSQVCDAPVQQRATLRVSALAAALTLGLAALGDGPSAPAALPRAVVIAQPELVLVKAQDRVTSVPDALSPFRRRALAAEAVPAAGTANAADAPAETTATTRMLTPAREAEAVDAGFIRTGEQMFRLSGIITPEHGKSCRRLDGLAVPCADRAQSYLQLLIKGRAVVCERAAQGPSGPAEANCRVGDADIAEQLVRQGWARAGHQPEERFMVAEASAKKQKLGIWRE